ncbi:MAG: GNAT family N-acetyltransferase [Dehalococcoidia bacterium]|nr:GNAT family N-acetyltransferase [Dehalococcoidia bacterium]
MNDVLIRPYEPGDQPGVRWLYERTPPAGRTYVRPATVDPDLEQIAANYEAFWVAIEPTQDGDAVVGITGLERAGSRAIGVPAPEFIDTSRPTARLHHVMVVPERQRRGVGRQLMHAAIDWARGHGYAALILETTAEQEAAVAFYEALGFSELGRTTFKRWQMVWFGLEI